MVIRRNLCAPQTKARKQPKLKMLQGSFASKTYLNQTNYITSSNNILILQRVLSYVYFLRNGHHNYTHIV